MREVAMFFALAASLAAAAYAAPNENVPQGIGEPVDDATLRRIDIDVAPDGSGAPPGRGDARTGETLFATRCASCHGIAIRLPPEHWPYATTLFDYVRRAMPPDPRLRLRDEEVYSIVAYELYMNGIASRDLSLDAASLRAVKMPGLKLLASPR